MESSWWSNLDRGRGRRGSRPRCVLLVDGTRREVAGRLTSLVNFPDVKVTESDFWMPEGKPAWTNGEWNFDPAREAQLDKDGRLVSSDVRHSLRTWWFEVSNNIASTPNWDVASTCRIEGRDGLLLVQAKAHVKELSNSGKPRPSTENGQKNHEKIDAAIKQARMDLEAVTGGSWGLSRDSHYQLSNRFAWCWKLARLGVPVVLVYLGFRNAEDMASDGTLFRTGDDWTRVLKHRARDVVDNSCWGRRLVLNGTPFIPLIRTMEVQFPPDV